VTAQAGTVPRGAASHGTRLRATARSEWIKFRSVRSAPFVAVSAAVILLAGAWLLGAGYSSGWATMTQGDRAVFDPVYTTLRGTELAQLFVGALGAATVTGEYASGLIRGTFLATPQRAQVLAMKALVFAAAVWAWCTALSFPAFFLGQSLLAPATHVALGDPGVLAAVFGAGLYLTLVGLLGMFIGVLVRRTPGALTALFGLLVVAPLAVDLVPGRAGLLVGEYLPMSAGEQGWRLLQGAPYSLGPWQGLGVLAAYAAVAALAAFALVRKRDA
jgi:ABC-type transport system involved in multi-copper enzyme maturation permease subunit